MGLLNVIRRMALREKLLIREIAHQTGLSRSTFKKYLKAGTIEPKFSISARSSKLDPYAVKLSAWLMTVAAKSSKCHEVIAATVHSAPQERQLLEADEPQAR